MKIHACPVPYGAPNYDNYDNDVEQAREGAHKAALVEWLKTNGYGGKNSGRIYKEPVADGYAQYMVAEGKDKFALIHLPYVDGYRSLSVQYLPKAEIIARVCADENYAKFFTNREVQVA